MSLGVYWDGREVGRLELIDEERSREYAFRYTQASRAISLSLPLPEEQFNPMRSRPFFEALLPEGAVRDLIAQQLRVGKQDSYGLLAELGRECAGALQIAESKRMSEQPAVEWLDSNQLSAFIESLPRHPLGMNGDEKMRLSLAGVQHKAVLFRDGNGQFGKPLNGMPSTHILKPDFDREECPGVAINEYFCMRLATMSGLNAAPVELLDVGGRACLVVERFDRDTSFSPPKRVHQEDLCQALGLMPDFKYGQEDWGNPSLAGLAELLIEHSSQPGIDRLAGANAAVFNFLVGNADAHAKNISLIHGDDGVHLSPLYDVVSTAVYGFTKTLSLSIGGEFDPDKITDENWDGLAADFGLNAAAFARERRQLADRVVSNAEELSQEAMRAGWHGDPINEVVAVVNARRLQIA